MFQSFFVAYFPACAVCSMQSFSNRLPNCESGKAPIPHTTSGNKPVFRLNIFHVATQFSPPNNKRQQIKIWADYIQVETKNLHNTLDPDWAMLGGNKKQGNDHLPRSSKTPVTCFFSKTECFFPDSVYLFVCLFVCWLVKCVLLLPHNVFATAVSTKPVNNRMHLQKHSACTVHKKLSTTDVSFPPKQPKSWPKSLVFFFSKRLTRWGKWLWRFGRSEGNWLYGGKWRQVEPAFHPCHAVRPQAHCTTLGGLWSGYAGAGEMTLQVLQ